MTCQDCNLEGVRAISKDENGKESEVVACPRCGRVLRLLKAVSK